MHKRLLATLLLAATALAAGKPADSVKYRQSVMKAMGAHMTALSMIAKGQVADRGQFTAHAEAIHALSGEIPNLFPAGSGPDKVKTSAKSDVWQRAADFKAAAAKLESESAKLVAAAKHNDAAARNTQFAATGEQCNGCHKVFRVRDTE